MTASESMQAASADPGRHRCHINAARDRKHQQYLDRNINGYCGIGGTGVSCPIGVAPAEG
ncbi:hypothetical protein GCM10011579_001980 [Streptomyces albiflavescens]|uniref:Uncharacterized protein n=1 Tax=Streptomyces albiflavescens TaxID=1623582 RepID=A0A918CYH5_9ACTN|nr:hypothetical protein GCM10011579_001980 [Streptomyces albiflavescens]